MKEFGKYLEAEKKIETKKQKKNRELVMVFTTLFLIGAGFHTIYEVRGKNIEDKEYLILSLILIPFAFVGIYLRKNKTAAFTEEGRKMIEDEVNKSNHDNMS